MFTQRIVNKWEKVTQTFSCKLKSNALLYWLLEKSNIINVTRVTCIALPQHC